MRPRKYPKRYSCAYHSDEDDRDLGLSIKTLMCVLSGFVLIYGTIMLFLYQEEISKAFYNILKFIWL